MAVAQGLQAIYESFRDSGLEPAHRDFIDGLLEAEGLDSKQKFNLSYPYLLSGLKVMNAILQDYIRGNGNGLNHLKEVIGMINEDLKGNNENLENHIPGSYLKFINDHIILVQQLFVLNADEYLTRGRIEKLLYGGFQGSVASKVLNDSLLDILGSVIYITSRRWG